jgi:hypothetical protein
MIDIEAVSLPLGLALLTDGTTRAVVHMFDGSGSDTDEWTECRAFTVALPDGTWLVAPASNFSPTLLH